MRNQPPSPTFGPSTQHSPADGQREDGVVVTTSQLSSAIEELIDYRPAETDLEEWLFELERRGYVEWVALTRDGAHVWDLTESPDRIADAVAERLVEELRSLV